MFNFNFSGKGLGLAVLQITVGHRLLPNVYESWSVKRNCKFVKMTEQNLPIAEIFYSRKILKSKAKSCYVTLFFLFFFL